MANGYTIYTTLKDRVTRAVRKGARSTASKEGKKRMRSPNFSEEVIREFYKAPGSYQTLDSAVLMDEHAWERTGGSILFPESTDLVEMLWRAKMNIEHDSLEDFPESFVVSWPNGTVVNGFELPPVLVSWASYNDREYLFEDYRRKYLNPATVRISQEGYSLDEKNLHLSYGNIGPDGIHSYYRNSVPKHKVTEILTSSQVLFDIGFYTGFGCLKLSDEEVELQWTLERMVLHLLVYMQACPDAVRNGWPDKAKERNYRTKNMPNLKPTKITGPKMPKMNSGHAGPIPHWRDAHGRSYPRRKDGTRRKGVIWVNGCVVNAKCDPKTIIEVKNAKRRA